MVKPQHRTPEYRRAYAALVKAQRAGVVLTCVQGLYGSSGTCLMRTREILPWMKADVAHDDAGQLVIGPAHSHCNRSEAATRGNRMRTKPRRLIL